MKKDCQLKIAFLSEFSPDDKKASSGTNYKIAQSLRSIGDVKWVQIKDKRGKSCRILRSVVLRLFSIFRKQIDLMHCKIGAKLCYEPIDTETLEKFDVICAFFCMQNIYDIKTNKPIVYFSDATFPAMIDYYPSFTNLPGFNQKQGSEMERDACLNSAAIIYSSDWAANSAIKDLGIPREKIHIIEYGANLDDKDINGEEKVYKEPLNLLFLGVDWHRKGGKIAADATFWLNRNGIKANLHIIGLNSVPSEYCDKDCIKVHGFLNKNKGKDYIELTKLIQESHCLLLPTVAECSAIAFAEASANGLPIFTHDTGGISNYVSNGVNGYMLPLGSSGEDFGKIIKDCYQSGKLPLLSQSAQKLYRTKLNWGVWKDKIEQVIKGLVNQDQNEALY